MGSEVWTTMDYGLLSSVLKVIWLLVDLYSHTKPSTHVLDGNNYNQIDHVLTKTKKTTNGENHFWMFGLSGGLTDGSTITLLLPRSIFNWLHRQRRPKTLSWSTPPPPGKRLPDEYCLHPLSDLSSEPDVDHKFKWNGFHDHRLPNQSTQKLDKTRNAWTHRTSQKC